MLVLSRKENEAILIGDDIVITVSRISGNRVRFAIDAPKEVRIVRSELIQQGVAEVAKPLAPPATEFPNSGEFGYAVGSVGR